MTQTTSNPWYSGGSYWNPQSSGYADPSGLPAGTNGGYFGTPPFVPPTLTQNEWVKTLEKFFQRPQSGVTTAPPVKTNPQPPVTTAPPVKIGIPSGLPPASSTLPESNPDKWRNWLINILVYVFLAILVIVGFGGLVYPEGKTVIPVPV